MIASHMQLFQSLIWLLSTGLLQESAPSTVSVVELPEAELRSKLLAIHKGFERTRAEAYGNCGFSATVSVKFDGKEQVTFSRYWSRENKFFRIDVLESEKPDAKVMHRLIVRPEGFVSMVDAGNGLAVTDYGDSETGKGKLFSYLFFIGSTRANNLGAEYLFSKFAGIEGFAQGGEGVEIQTAGQQTTDGGIEIRVNSVSPKGTSKCRMVMSGFDAGAKLDGFECNVVMDGKPYSSNSTTFAYLRESSDVIASETSETRTDRNGKRTDTLVKCDQIDATPQELSIFALDSNSKMGTNPPSSVWVRRMIIGVTGLIVLSVLFVLRRMSMSRRT